MRTKVILDPDVQALVEDASRRSRKPFNVTLNEVLRTALIRQQDMPRDTAIWPTWNLGPPLIDLTKAMAIADQLEDLPRFERPSA